MDQQLKRCPFCGDNLIVETTNRCSETNYIISHKTKRRCIATYELSVYSTIKKISKAVNNRPIENELVEAAISLLKQAQYAVNGDIFHPDLYDNAINKLKEALAQAGVRTEEYELY